MMAQTDSAKNSKKQHQLLVFPLVARSIETDWSFGVAASTTMRLYPSDTVSRTSNMQALVLYSLKNQFIAAINGTQYFKNEKYILNEQISYSSFPDKFWGIGKYASDKNEESYSFKQYYIYAHLLRKLTNKLYLGGIYEMQRLLEVTYKAGGIFDVEDVAGRTPYTVSGLGLSLTFDTRNDAFSPNKGSFYQLYFNHFNSALGSTFNYTNWVVDVRKFFRFYKQQVLALQAYGFVNVGEKTPLRSLASFGGNTSMRGYYDGRYRDRNQFVIQSEYRIPVYKRIGLTAFGSIGDVSNKIDNFSFNTIKSAYGAGFRFAINKKEKLNLRIDYGFNAEGGSGLYFELAEAF